MELNCKNCAESLGESQDYCSHCGAKVIRRRITLRNILGDFSEQFLNWDNKFVQTFIDMFRRPEDVVGGYISGVRKRYMNVLGYFAVSITYLGFYTYINQKFFPDANKMIFESMSNDPNATAASLEVMSVFAEFQSFIIVSLIPILALISWILFLKNKYNYVEHIVVSIYGYSHVTYITTTIGFTAQFSPKAFMFFSFFSLLIQIGYFFYLLKRVFSVSLGKMIWKTFLFLLMLIVLYIIFIIIMMIYFFLFTDFFQKAIEAEKAKRGISYMISSAMNWTS